MYNLISKVDSKHTYQHLKHYTEKKFNLLPRYFVLKIWSNLEDENDFYFAICDKKTFVNLNAYMFYVCHGDKNNNFLSIKEMENLNFCVSKDCKDAKIYCCKPLGNNIYQVNIQSQQVKNDIKFEIDQAKTLQTVKQKYEAVKTNLAKPDVLVGASFSLNKAYEICNKLNTLKNDCENTKELKC